MRIVASRITAGIATTAAGNTQVSARTSATETETSGLVTITATARIAGRLQFTVERLEATVPWTTTMPRSIIRAWVFAIADGVLSIRKIGGEVFDQLVAGTTTTTVFISVGLNP